MQKPTCINTRITTTDDAHRVFHAAGVLNILGPMVHRRLDAEERRYVRPGSVFVWEERSTTSEAAGLGIERWTDGLRWGPSRVRDFLFYQEKFTKAEGHNILTKQTYSAWVDLPTGPKKWHLTAYFTQATIDKMRSVDDIPRMKEVLVPPGMYKRSRSSKRKSDNRRPSMSDLPSPLSIQDSPQHERGNMYPLYIPFHESSPRRMSISSGSDQPEEEIPWNWKRTRERPSRGFSSEKQVDPSVSTGLAPLCYLESLHHQHPRRNPADEVVLRTFASFN